MTLSLRMSSMSASPHHIFSQHPSVRKQCQALSMSVQAGPSRPPHIPAFPSFLSPLHLHLDTQCWINIPNTCSGLGSPYSKLHPLWTSGRKSEFHTLTSQSHHILQPQPIPTFLHPLERQATANVLVFHKAPKFLPPHLCSHPSSHWKSLISAFKYT